MSKNLRCQCPNKTCARHGDCKACRKHHESNQPFCMRQASGAQPQSSQSKEEK